MINDKIINVNNNPFSLRKIIGEEAWVTYNKTTEKVRKLLELQVRLDLSAIELGFERLNKLMDKKPK